MIKKLSHSLVPPLSKHAETHSNCRVSSATTLHSSPPQLGDMVGIMVGTIVGETVGDSVGETVGETVGPAVGAHVTLAEQNSKKLSLSTVAHSLSLFDSMLTLTRICCTFSGALSWNCRT